MLSTRNIVGLFTDFESGLKSDLSLAEKILFLTLKMLADEGSLSKGWSEAQTHLKNQLLMDVLDSLSSGDSLNNKPEALLERAVFDLKEHGVIPSSGRIRKRGRKRDPKVHEQIRLLLK